MDNVEKHNNYIKKVNFLNLVLWLLRFMTFQNLCDTDNLVEVYWHFGLMSLNQTPIIYLIITVALPMYLLVTHVIWF
jgi:hypothetical protein